MKPYIEFNTQEGIEAVKNNDKDERALRKLMNAIYGKAMENLRNRINVKSVSNEKNYLKCTSKPSYILLKIFDNLVAIRKSKVALNLTRLAYIRMCILELSKLLMYEFHYDYIKHKYHNKLKLFITDTHSLMYEIKTEDVYGDFSRDKEMFDFRNYWTKSKYYDDSNRVVIGKMREETRGVAIEGFVGLQPKIYSFWAGNSEHKKAATIERNVAATISHNEYKDVLLDNKCTRHSVIYFIENFKKISLSCSDNKIHI